MIVAIFAVYKTQLHEQDTQSTVHSTSIAVRSDH